MARRCESVTDTSIYWPYSLRENHSKDNSEDNTKDLYMSSGCLLLLRCFRFYIGRYLYQKKMRVITRSTVTACTVCSLCCTFEIYKDQVPGTYCKTGLVRYRLVTHRNHSQASGPLLSLGWLDASDVVSSWLTPDMNSSKGLNLALALRSEGGSA